VLTDSSGNVTGTYSYDAYGSTTSHTGGGGTPLQYAGQYLDGETGLQYLQARYYDPSTAQFISVDPLVGATGQPYGYAGGNPLALSDPRGLACQAGTFTVPGPFGSGGNCSSNIGVGTYNVASQALSHTASPAYAPSAPSGCSIGTIPGLGSVNIDTKIRRQMLRRGWTDQDIEEVIRSPALTKSALVRRTGDPATIHYRSDGYYVIRNDVNGDIVQISDRNDPNSIDDTTNSVVRPIQDEPVDSGPGIPTDPIGPGELDIPLDPIP
jgi:RHS repeat-associated protein